MFWLLLPCCCRCRTRTTHHPVSVFFFALSLTMKRHEGSMPPFFRHRRTLSCQSCWRTSSNTGGSGCFPLGIYNTKGLALFPCAVGNASKSVFGFVVRPSVGFARNRYSHVVIYYTKGPFLFLCAVGNASKNCPASLIMFCSPRWFRAGREPSLPQGYLQHEGTLSFPLRCGKRLEEYPSPVSRIRLCSSREPLLPIGYFTTRRDSFSSEGRSICLELKPCIEK